ncbi:MAG: hypothetical protein LBS72_02050 [Oscillospiraceae bacterium]|nr:hypothetical protein [Oscillospiraceae bacterium]
MLETPQSLRVTATNLAGVQNKQLRIKIPEGLNILEYPGMNGGAIPEEFQGLITGVIDAPIHKDSAGQPARFGEIVYTLSDNLGAISIDISLQVDRYRLYAQNVQLKQPIVTTLSYGDPAINVQSELAVQASMIKNFSLYFYMGVNSRKIAREAIECSGNGSALLNTYPFVPKSAVVTFKYPDQAVLEGVKYNIKPNGTVPSGSSIYVGPGGNGASIVADEANHEVRFYYGAQQIAGMGICLKFPADTGVANGEYKVYESAKATMYDDTEIDIPPSSYTLTLITSTPNRLVIENRTWAAGVSAMPGLTVMNSPRFMNYNPNAIDGQTIRYDFPEQLHIRAFSFPVEANPATSGRDFTVKYGLWNKPGETFTVVNKGAYQTYTDPILVFSPIALGLQEGDTVEWAEADVGPFPLGYQQFFSETAWGSPFWGSLDASEQPGVHSYTTHVTIKSTVPDGDGPQEFNVITNVSQPTVSLRLIFSVAANTDGSYIFAAGDEIKVSVQLTVFDYIIHMPLLLINKPDMFILIPPDMDIKQDSLTITQSGSSVLGARRVR